MNLQITDTLGIQPFISCRRLSLGHFVYSKALLDCPFCPLLEGVSSVILLRDQLELLFRAAFEENIL